MPQATQASLQAVHHDTSTYEERSTDSARLPGAIVDGMRFVL